MPVIRGVINRSNSTGVRHPTAQIVSERGHRLRLSFAPQGVSHGGEAALYDSFERVGRKPIITETGEELHVMSCSLILARRNNAGVIDQRRPIEGQIRLLRSMAKRGDRVRLANMGEMESGWYYITTLSYQVAQREEKTNKITLATVSLAFTEVSSAKINVGPVSGGSRRSPNKKSKKKSSGRKPKDPGKRKPKPETPTRFYTVKQGDTLWKIAHKFYGDGSEYPKIAKANNIRNPNLIHPGDRLKIPS